MEIEEVRQDDIAIVVPDGALGSAPACATLDHKLAALIEGQAHKIVIDCRKVDQINSAALRVLLRAKRKLTPHHGQLVLCELTSQVRSAFAIAHFDRDFTVLASREDAVRRLGGTSAEPTPPPPSDQTRPGLEAAARLAAHLLGAGLAPLQNGLQLGVRAEPALPQALCDRILVTIGGVGATINE